MTLRDLSKLQIRSEVLLMLQKLISLDEMSKEQLDNNLTKFRSIKDIGYVVEVLVKELARANYKKGQIISLFIQELGDLDSVKDVLWSYIKSPKYSDELKDLSGLILKSLGDQTDPEEFLNYLEDPKAIVDKETQKLLEVASTNPEAQIDFLDFLFSLPESEQINLVNSLKDDYSSEYLVNIVVPALEANPAPRLEEELVKILGETRSVFAVPALNDVLKYSKNEFIKKHAQKSLNMLKLSGINTNLENKYPANAPITQCSVVYECHTNVIDGIGNQGFIISRIKPNQDVLMLNVVVNDIHGILDCFGFYGITKQDFSRIVEKFQEASTRFFVSPEYCKLKLDEAEKINKENNLPIPYEYAAWKSLISDISALENNFEELSKTWVSEDLINEANLLYKFPDFKHWFFEEEDHPLINETLNYLIKEISEKNDYFINNQDELKNWLELKTDKLLVQLFSNDETKNIYKKRLLDLSYLFDFQDLQLFRNIVASLAWSITPENGCDIKTINFFREMIKRTILEGFIRYQYKIDQGSAETFSLGKKKQDGFAKTLQGKDLSQVVHLLCNL